MHQSKMAFIVDRDEIMIVLVHLYRRQLAFVDNVLIAQGAEVEPVVKANCVGRTLSKYVQLALELLLVEGLRVSEVWCFAAPVSGLEHDEGLQN